MIVVCPIETSLYYYCIPEEFDECPEAETGFEYQGQGSLTPYSKDEWRQNDTCNDQVKVTDTDSGYSANVIPLKLEQR